MPSAGPQGRSGAGHGGPAALVPCPRVSFAGVVGCYDWALFYETNFGSGGLETAAFGAKILNGGAGNGGGFQKLLAWRGRIGFMFGHDLFEQSLARENAACL